MHFIDTFQLQRYLKLQYVWFKDNCLFDAQKQLHVSVYKYKFTLEQTTKAQRGCRCIAVLFLQPRRRVWVGGQRHTPTSLPPGKTRYPVYRRLDGPHGRSGRVRKISPPGRDLIRGPSSL